MTAAAHFDPYDLDFRRDPYPTYAALRRADPVHRSAYGPTVLSRYQDCSRVLSDPVFSHEGPNEPEAALPALAMLSETMLFRDPPDHTRLRGQVAHAFTPRTVDALRPRVADIVAELLDEAGERFDLIEDFAHPLPVRVICELLDIPSADHDDIRRWSADLAGVVDIALELDVVAKGERAAAALETYFADLVALRAQRPKGDLVSVLATSSELDEREVLAVCVQLLFGGHETTQNLIGTGMLHLLQAREQLRELKADRSLLPNAVEEMLRFDGPGQLAGRWATQDVDFDGGHVEAGTQILVLLGAANRDPEVFDDPDGFDIHRRGLRHLTFGGGIHFCLGAPLARMEAAVAFDALVDRFADVELDGEPRWRPTLALRGLAELPLRRSR